MVLNSPYLEYSRFKSLGGRTKQNHTHTTINNSEKPLKVRRATQTQPTFKGFSLENKNDQISFSGSLPAEASGKAIEELGPLGRRFAKSLTKDGGVVNRVAKLASKIPGLADSFFVLGLAGVLRPITIMALPNFDKSGKSDKQYQEDKKYSAAHAISSAVVGTIAAFALFDPIGKAADRLKEKGLKAAVDNDALIKKYHAFSHDTGVAIKWLTAPLVASALVALIPPIVKRVLHGKQHKEKELPKDHPFPFATSLKSKESSAYRTYIQLSGRKVAQ